jgi:hypothetical protein
MKLLQKQDESLRLGVKVGAGYASLRDVQRPPVIAVRQQEFDEMYSAPGVCWIILDCLPQMTLLLLSLL